MPDQQAVRTGMSAGEKELRRRERAATIGIWIAGRAARNRSLLDRVCRRLLEKATGVDGPREFMRDPLIDEELGFDPDELERYQRGERD